MWRPTVWSFALESYSKTCIRTKLQWYFVSYNSNVDFNERQRYSPYQAAGNINIILDISVYSFFCVLYAFCASSIICLMHYYYRLLSCISMHVLYDDVRSSVLLAAHVIVKITTMMIMMIMMDRVTVSTESGETLQQHCLVWICHHLLFRSHGPQQIYPDK